MDQKLRDNISPRNKLDAAAREHDIFYDQHPDVSSRNQADKVLEGKAWERVKASDATVGEKVAGWITTNVMKVKRKLGKGVCGRSRRKKVVKGIKHNVKHGKGIQRSGKKATNRTLTFKQLVSKANSAIRKKKIQGIEDAVEESLNSFKGIRVKRGLPRIIPIAQRGSGIRLVPIISALSKVGKVFDGISSIVGGVQKIKEVRDEYKRFKSSGEKQIGNGLLFTKYKRGYGLRLR